MARGELLITHKIFGPVRGLLPSGIGQLVRGCLISSNRRHVSIAITAWSARKWTPTDLLSVGMGGLTGAKT